jgi:hypothetical protein
MIQVSSPLVGGDFFEGAEEDSLEALRIDRHGWSPEE